MTDTHYCAFCGMGWRQGKTAGNPHKINEEKTLWLCDRCEGILKEITIPIRCCTNCKHWKDYWDNGSDDDDDYGNGDCDHFKQTTAYDEYCTFWEMKTKAFFTEAETKKNLGEFNNLLNELARKV